MTDVVRDTGLRCRHAGEARRFNPIHRMTLTGPDCTTVAIK